MLGYIAIFISDLCQMFANNQKLIVQVLLNGALRSAFNHISQSSSLNTVHLVAQNTLVRGHCDYFDTHKFKS